jgi:hypothetical protein
MLIQKEKKNNNSAALYVAAHQYPMQCSTYKLTTMHNRNNSIIRPPLFTPQHSTAARPPVSLILLLLPLPAHHVRFSSGRNFGQIDGQPLFRLGVVEQQLDFVRLLLGHHIKQVRFPVSKV